MLNNHISVATIMYATASPCVPLNGMFHQDSAMQWNKNFDVSNSLGKRHANSVGTQYVCDKSKTARVCAKWQWNALDWCYRIALPASLVVQSSNTVSFVSHTPVHSHYVDVAWCVAMHITSHDFDITKECPDTMLFVPHDHLQHCVREKGNRWLITEENMGTLITFLGLVLLYCYY